MLVLEHLFDGLSKTIQHKHFKYILESVVLALKEEGVDVNRLQIPMNKLAGLRHPIYAVIVLTYKDGELDVLTRGHQSFDEEVRSNQMLQGTPFSEVFGQRNRTYRCNLRSEKPKYALLEKLQEDGFTDYLCASMELPHGPFQIFSVTTKAANGFPEHIEDIIQRFFKPLSLCLFAAYQSSVTNSLTEVYLGRRTGHNVLNGKFYRGTQEIIDAGIMFCDVRGFTAMSEQLGAQQVVEVMNAVFQEIESEIRAYDGEILKFIGDALLVIFPREDHHHDQELGAKMITVALNAVQKVEALGHEKNLPLSVGFGCHIGEVLYGNIGTENRLDFTVMGPSVNLTSRLESMCKSLGAQLTVSTEVAYGNYERLESFGEHMVKGIAEPVEIWGVRVNS